MATKWIKSLQCKSNALNDVVHHHHRRSLSHSSSCKGSVQSLKDVVDTTTKHKKPAQTPPFRRPVSRKPDPAPHQIQTRSSSSETFFPSLTELPEGHPSRNVVEIIFHTSWGDKTFPGQVEMVFKVQNPARTATRFEEYRGIVKSRAATSSADPAEGIEDHARSVADGNEVMRFYCLGATSGGGAYEAGCGAWASYGGKGASVCTYSGSGLAHEKAGGGKGRRAMLVCRVIAGRVCKQPVVSGRVDFDSVDGEEDGELLVFDARALLPCFLIIYKL